MSGSATPSLDRIINDALENRLFRMFGGWLPGRIESFDAASQRADVQLQVMDVERDASDTPSPKRFASIVNAPVVLPGSGGNRVTWPIARGDTCVVLFAARSIDKWKHIGSEVAPDDERHHHLSDALVIPNLDIKRRDAATQIAFSDVDVQVGGLGLPAQKLCNAAHLTALDLHLVTLNAIIAIMLSMPAMAAYIAAIPLGAGTAAATAYSDGVTAYTAGIADYLTQILKGA